MTDPAAHIARLWALASTALLTVSISPPAMAQETQDGSVLMGELVVLGNTEDATGPVTSNNPPTNTGSKVPIFWSEVPQALTILDTEDLTRFNADRVTETLRYTPGVQTDVFGDDNDYDWLRIRGFQADQTGVFLDNAQNLSFAFGSFFIDPYTLQRIEVLRGPSSALFGGSNPGGIVNYVSKRPGVRVREVVLGVDDAARGYGAFDVGDAIDDTQAFRIVGTIEGGNHYDAFNSGLRGSLAPSYRVVLPTGTEVTLLANLHLAEEQHNGSTFLPYVGTVEAAPGFGLIGEDANFSDPDWDDYSRQQFSASVIAEHTFGNDFTLTGIGRVGIASVEERYWFPFGYAGFSPTPSDDVGTLSLLAFEHDTIVRTAQTDIRYYGTVNTGPVSHDLLFGLDARVYSLDEKQFSAFGSNQVVGRFDPGEPTFSAPFQDAETTQYQIGVYVQDQLRFGDGFILTGSLRHDFADTEQDGTFGFSRDDSEFSYRGAIAYEFANGITPYFSYSTFFNPLIVSPANGVTEPERGDQFEAGVKWAPEGENFYLAGAIFQIDRENVVSGVFPSFNQLGEVRSRGIELEGGYDFGFGLTVEATATFLDLEITEDSDPNLIGNEPTLNPSRQLTLRADYAFPDPAEGLTIGAGVRHRGKSFANGSNTLRVPSSTLFDLYASYELTERVALSLSATNVGDRRYVTGCQTEFVCSYGAGREIKLQVTKNW